MQHSTLKNSRTAECIIYKSMTFRTLESCICIPKRIPPKKSASATAQRNILVPKPRIGTAYHKSSKHMVYQWLGGGDLQDRVWGHRSDKLKIGKILVKVCQIFTQNAQHLRDSTSDWGSINGGFQTMAQVLSRDLISEPPKRGRKTGAARKLSEKCRMYFWHFLAIFAVFCPARKMSKSVENIFDTFWRFLTFFWRGPFPLAPLAVRW